METSIYKEKGFTLSNRGLKLIAIIAMVIDHIAWKFVDDKTALWQIMHFIGRFTMPIMCYFIAEGFHRTRDVYKYFLRLMLFALISHYPFQYYLSGVIPVFDKRYTYYLSYIGYTSVIFNLALGLLVLIVIYKLKLHALLKMLLIVFILYISTFSDYGETGVLWVTAFGVFHKNKPLMVLSFLMITSTMVFQNFNMPESPMIFGTYIPIILILLYNGKKGEGRNLKWFFYIFYPLHILILGILRFAIFKDSFK